MSVVTWSLVRRIASGAMTAAGGAALVVVGPTSSAVAPASSSVSIHADGTDLFGHVSSPRARCTRDRDVIVYKQVGARGGGNDVRFAMDTSDEDGDWNTGNTGTEGKFYAKVKKNSQCKADFSRTIRATR